MRLCLKTFANKGNISISFIDRFDKKPIMDLFQRMFNTVVFKRNVIF